MILMGRHKARTDLGLQFGATDVVSACGEEGIGLLRQLTGGAAPTRAYISQLMPDILNGAIEPGKVFDLSTDLAGVPTGY
jgi:hypothetical protein